MALIKKILVTGGCGFIGSNIAEHLNSNNFIVDTLDNLSRSGAKLNEKRLLRKKIKNFRVNILNKRKIKRLGKYDIIIHCCAEPSVNTPKNKVNEIIRVNFEGTNNILEKCLKDKSKIIFMSSSRVYSVDKINDLIGKKIIKKRIKIKKKYSINEKFSTVSPITFYGFTKLASEMLIKEYANYFGIKYIINRPGVVAGPWQFGKVEQGFVSLWIWRYLNKMELSYKGYGGYGYQVRDVIHIDDFKDITLKQILEINKIYNKTFNVGGGLSNSIDLKKLSQLVSQLFSYKLKFSKFKATSINDVPVYISDNTYISKLYKWKPKKKIVDIILDTYNWQKKYQSVLKKFI